MAANNNGKSGERRGTRKEPETEVVKRVELMPDGRYMIFYTFPELDNEQADPTQEAITQNRK